VPLADLLILACASVHGLEIAHDDAHFEALAKLPA
jgi:predicted nucleic acid-binding protein